MANPLKSQKSTAIGRHAPTHSRLDYAWIVWHVILLAWQINRVSSRGSSKPQVERLALCRQYLTNGCSVSAQQQHWQPSKVPGDPARMRHS